MPPVDKDQIRRTRSVTNIHVSPIHEDDDVRIEAQPERLSLQGQQGTQLLRNPLNVHPVTADLDKVQLIQPDREMIENAYKATDIEYAASDRKRKNLYEESLKRYNLQKSLSKKIKANNNPQQHIEVDIKKAMELSDEKLVAGYGRYKGAAKAYLSYRYRLIRNKYYNLLPIGEMRKMERLALLQKLRVEYTKEPRDPELIFFYEDLVRLKIMEDSQDEKKRDRPNPDDPPVGISEEERSHNRKAFLNNSREIEKLPVTAAEKEKRVAVMKKVMDPQEGESVWTEEESRHISEQQKEGLRSILAWMYRNCNKSSESKEAFVYRLTKARPEQLLLAFYLIENNMQDAPNPECFHKAITGYIPDIGTFKDRVVASKLRFWKRIGSDSSDSVINWSKIGMATRFALKDDTVTDYLNYTDEAERLTAELENAAEDQKESLINDLLIQKGNLLLTMYRAAGLSPDMPADLIQEPTLKAKVGAIVGEFSHYLGLLNELNVAREGKQFDKEAREKKPGDAQGAPGGSKFQRNLNEINIAGKYVLGTMSFTKLSSFMGESVKSITMSDTYIKSADGIGVICSFVGLVSAIMGAIKLGSGANLTAADHLSQGLSIGSGMATSATSVFGGGADLLNRLNLIDLGNKVTTVDAAKSVATANVPWYGNTEALTAEEMFKNAAGGITYVTGVIGVAAGTALATSGIIDISRGISSRNDLIRARKAMLDEKQKNAKKNIVLTEEQQKEREKLRNLMNHQNRALSNQEFSGTVKMIGGVLTAAGGALSMTGILAPIGGILSVAGTIVNVGLGIMYARRKRNITRRKAVDDGLKLEKALDKIKNEVPGYANMTEKDRDMLRGRVRQEALGELGYATYKEAFSDLSKMNAALLYRKVFTLKDNTDEYKMYFETLKSLGFKIKKAGEGQKNNIPTVQMIYSKLMG